MQQALELERTEQPTARRGDPAEQGRDVKLGEGEPQFATALPDRDAPAHAHDAAGFERDASFAERRRHPRPVACPADDLELRGAAFDLFGGLVGEFDVVVTPALAQAPDLADDPHVLGELPGERGLHPVVELGDRKGLLSTRDVGIHESVGPRAVRVGRDPGRPGRALRPPARRPAGRERGPATLLGTLGRREHVVDSPPQLRPGSVGRGDVGPGDGVLGVVGREIEPLLLRHAVGHHATKLPVGPIGVADR